MASETSIILCKFLRATGFSSLVNTDALFFIIFLKFKTSFSVSTNDNAIQSTPNFNANFKSSLSSKLITLILSFLKPSIIVF